MRVSPSEAEVQSRRAAPARRGWLRRNRRWLGLAGLAVLVLVAVVGGLALREGLALRRDLLRAQAEFDQALAVTDPVLADFGSFRETSATLEQAAAHLTAADQSLASAEAHRRRLGPLLAVGAKLPGWMGGLDDVEPLLASARELARAGMELSDGFTAMTARIDEGRGGTEASGRRLAAGLSVGEPSFDRALAALESARAQRQVVTRNSFGGPLSPATEALAEFDERYGKLHENAVLLAQLPAALRAVLGMEGPRTYAVLGQNSAELRPTGGFIGSLGLMTVEDGAITVEDYRGVYLLERPERGYPPAPAPIARYLGGVENGTVGWGLRDANWSPDFPTTARTVEEMLKHHQDVDVDGVLGFTTYAVGELLEALGPLDVPGFAEPVTAESWYQDSERLIYGEQPGVRVVQGSEENKGEVLGPVLQAIVGRMQQANAEELPALLRTFQELVEQRQILVAFDDPAPNALAARYRADGRLALPSTGDLLAVVDANVSYAKIGAYIDEQIEYDVWLNARGLPEKSQVTVSYANRITPAQALDPTRRIGGSEVDPATRRFRSVPGLYGTYVRVYVPGKSRLLGMEPEGAQVFAGEERGLLSLERYERVPAQGQAGFSYTYQTPTDRQEPGTYRLQVVKQPGTAGHALVVRVHLPPGVAADPSVPMTREGDTLVYQGRLEQTLDLGVFVRDPAP